MTSASRIQLIEPDQPKVVIDLTSRPGKTITVGNAHKTDSHISLATGLSFISKRHCTLSKIGNVIWVADGAEVLNNKGKPTGDWKTSTNGTWVNSERIVGKQQLKPGDAVGLGDPTKKLFAGYRILILSDETLNETATDESAVHSEIIRRCRAESLRHDECGVIGLEVLPMQLGTHIKFADSVAEKNLGFQTGELVQAINELGIEQCISARDGDSMVSAAKDAISQEVTLSGTYQTRTGPAVTIGLFRVELDKRPNQFFLIALIYAPSGASETYQSGPMQSEKVGLLKELLTFIDRRPLMGWTFAALWIATLIAIYKFF